MPRLSGPLAALQLLKLSAGRSSSAFDSLAEIPNQACPRWPPLEVIGQRRCAERHGRSGLSLWAAFDAAGCEVQLFGARRSDDVGGIVCSDPATYEDFDSASGLPHETSDGIRAICGGGRASARQDPIDADVNQALESFETVDGPIECSVKTDFERTSPFDQVQGAGAIDCAARLEDADGHAMGARHFDRVDVAPERLELIARVNEITGSGPDQGNNGQAARRQCRAQEAIPRRHTAQRKRGAEFDAIGTAGLGLGRTGRRICAHFEKDPHSQEATACLSRSRL